MAQSKQNGHPVGPAIANPEISALASWLVEQARAAETLRDRGTITDGSGRQWPIVKTVERLLHRFVTMSADNPAAIQLWDELRAFHQAFEQATSQWRSENEPWPVTERAGKAKLHEPETHETVSSIGPPAPKLLVRDNDACRTMDYVAAASIPPWACEYHIADNIWSPIPSIWRSGYHWDGPQWRSQTPAETSK